MTERSPLFVPDIEATLRSLTQHLRDGDLPGFEAGLGRLCDGALTPLPDLSRLTPWIEVMEGLHHARHAPVPS